MKRRIALRRIQVAMSAFCCIALRPFEACLAQGETDEPHAFPLSTTYVTAPGQTTAKMFYDTVEWNGRKYHAVEGTMVLMEVIANPAIDGPIRARALELLGRLRNRDVTEQLIALYDDLPEREEKLGVLRCLGWSQDPRGLPLFARVLDYERDSVVRLHAAIAFTEWNARRGVEELVALLESEATLAEPGHRVYIRDSALDMFLTSNRRKGWGFPENRVQQEIAARADLGDAQKRVLAIAEIKRWFAENERHFPDWKPGDALPAAPKLPPFPPGPESVLPLSAASTPPSAVWTPPQEEEISWKGKDYPATEGVALLMKVVLDPGSVGDHFDAIERLGHVGGRLRDTQRIPELMRLYGQLSDRTERVALLFCLARSKDPRALPMFAEILDTRKEDYLRLPAAYGLALWNARSGMRELIELLSVGQTESPIRYPGIIGDQAVHLLSQLNAWKSWWAPEAALQAAAEAGPEVHDKLLDSCHAELKKWFVENEHRFPDWKPGDPLPTDPSPERDQPSTSSHRPDGPKP